MTTKHGLRDYAVVTTAYWAFTITDGALRMLVLLTLNDRGYTPLAIASMFLLYEALGVVTSLVGGWLGARLGLKLTLFAGLGLQVAALGLLGLLAGSLSIPLLLGTQGMAGVAKDLTKTSAKSYIKLVVRPGDESRLMRMVSLLTGSKNALKGAGFFLGGVLLGTVGFADACLGMAGMLAVALLAAALLLPEGAGRSAAKLGLTSVLSRDARINWLATARLFLFGARDVWFVLALPIFLAESLGWSHSRVGAFLALWVIGYGITQAAAPAWVGLGRTPGRVPDAGLLGKWTLSLVLPLGALLLGLGTELDAGPLLVAGLTVFGVLFAANSAIHSYLIVSYAERDRVALTVGFYYSANAAGRLVGTVLSGAVFQAAGLGRSGLAACLWTSLGFVVVSALACRPLRMVERRSLTR